MSSAIDLADSKSAQSIRSETLIVGSTLAEEDRLFQWAKLDSVGSIDILHLGSDPQHWNDLFDMATRGDRSAFRTLLLEFDQMLSAILRPKLSSQTALDVIDDILRTAAKKVHTCDPKGSILAWLLSIANYRLSHPMRNRPNL